MKFTNNSNHAVHISGYGWFQPGEVIDIPKDDEKTIRSIQGLSFFEENGGASPPKTAKKTSKKDTK